MMTTYPAIKSASWEGISSVWLMIPVCTRIFPSACYGKCNGSQPKASGFRGLARTTRESRPHFQWFLSAYAVGHFLPGFCCFPDATLYFFANDCKNAEICGVVVNIFKRERTLALCINNCTTKDILSAMISSNCATDSCSSERRSMLSSHLLLTCLPWCSTFSKFI